ncbi:MAG: primosomal protein N', partial [Sphingobacteriales bacterium]
IEMVYTRWVERKCKQKLMISPQLQTEIEEAVKHKKQVILFQNRRGYSPYMICGTCGFIPHCEQCDVTLTFHKIYQKLQCHYCGNQYAPIITCPACGKVHWQEKNFGTEKIEEQLAELFPEFRIARMDIDTVRGKHAHDQLIQNFEQHRIDILVGTQMVVKGLDFDHVHLVGILDADGLLSFADFRVNERAFQLMEQVSGRAGRKDQRGKVLIQTTNPKHPVLGWVQLHDYKQLYQAEAEARQQFNYPPFSKMVQITFKHRLKHIAEAAANIMGGALHQAFPDQVSGPAEPVIGRIRNMYIMELLLRIPKTGKSFALAKTIIKQQMDLLQYDKTFRSVIIHPDVDPQ